MTNTPVLIVGGGPVGLSLALALARQNVSSILVERNTGVTNHPRARGVNIRTMELFQQWGNAAELLKFEQPKEARRFIWAESLQGSEITRVAINDDGVEAISPMQASFVSQDHVEASLHHALKKYPQSEIKLSHEFSSFEENEHGILATILNKETNTHEQIQARYLIAADGASSPIRKQLNIDMEGPDNLGQFCSVYCEMDISQYTKHRPAIGYFFTDEKLAGRFLASVDGGNRWIIGLRYRENSNKADFTDEFCIESIKQLVCMPDIDIKIINKSFWTMAAQIATQFQQGNVFLAGDAAHRLPPTGGFGMNTGIQDSHNLAWKLSCVINHGFPESLLKTYYDERAPVAKYNTEWSTENAKRYTHIYEALFAKDMERLKELLAEQQKHFNYAGLDIGFIYHSDAIQSESDAILSVSPSEFVPTALPGIRAPHIEIMHQGKPVSILSLFEKEFVLLVGEDGNAWQSAVDELVATKKIPLTCASPSIDHAPESDWLTLYGITARGAVLVRPDGHVAWRAKTSAGVSGLRAYFEKIMN